MKAAPNLQGSTELRLWRSGFRTQTPEPNRICFYSSPKKKNFWSQIAGVMLGRKLNIKVPEKSVTLNITSTENHQSQYIQQLAKVLFPLPFFFILTWHLCTWSGAKSELSNLLITKNLKSVVHICIPLPWALCWTTFGHDHTCKSMCLILFA